MTATYARIVGTGSYLPEKVLTNDDLAKMVETNDEWIVSRTGIRQRHIAASDQTTSDLALIASRAAIENAGLQPQDIDLIIVATTTPDVIFPSTAVILQNKLGIKRTPAFDVQAVCSGFVYALATADALIRAGQYKNALVVGAETMSRIIDWKDRKTCVLFGDGAGAVVVRADNKAGVLSSHLHADGSYGDALAASGYLCVGRGEATPFLRMEGGTVFKFAVKAFEEAALEALAANKLEKRDIDWLVPHQANIRIIEATADKLGLDMNKVVVTVERHANTSAASIPLALDVAARDGRLKAGQHVLLEAVGGGFTWGSVLLKW